MPGKMPEFIIIGAAKSGTTALYEYLVEHPEVFMSPIKETNFFAWDDGCPKSIFGNKPNNHFPIKSLSKYRDIFSKAEASEVCGEASPLYLESATAAKQIHNSIPGVKIIAILRNPADRAFSDYCMQIRHSFTDVSIEQGLDSNSHSVKTGYYHKMLSEYYNLFPSENILILKFEDLKSNPAGQAKKLFNFLGISDDFAPDFTKKHNAGGFPKNMFINKVLAIASRRETMKWLTPNWLVQFIKSRREQNWENMPEFPTELRSLLVENYMDEIDKLSQLTGLDFEAWQK
jgi:hypothetical protein